MKKKAENIKVHTILLQMSLAPEELNRLRKEFGKYRVLYYQFLPLNKEKEKERMDWEGVEILFGNRLTTDHLAQAKDLKWIHNPTPSHNRLCLKEILKQGNIIVTEGIDENFVPIAEFVMAGTLAFSKNLFHWHQLMQTPKQIWDSKSRDSMLTLPNHVFLQIGLGQAGTEIAKRAQQQGLKVWGMQQKRSFHPFCEETFTYQDLQNILHKVDIISICLPRNEQRTDLFTIEELLLMKKDAILIIVGAHTVVNEHALVEHAAKLRGILLDSHPSPPIALESPLWHLPNVIITPDVAARPRERTRQMFQIFHYNLRQYDCGNYKDMRNRIDLKG